MPTGEKFTGDLATDTIRWRFAKILTEKAFRKAGIAIGETGPARIVADTLKPLLGGDIPAQWLGSVVGIIAAALLQSPRIVADVLAAFIGINADKLHEMLNEGVDSGIQGLAGALQHPGGPNDGDILRAAGEAVKHLEDEHKFDFLDEIEVVIFGGVIHDAECTEVLDRESQQRRQRTGNQPQPDDDRPRLRPGSRKVKLAKACDMGYSTIALPKCCGKAVEKLLAKQAKKPADLNACVESLKDSAEDGEKALRIRYYALLAAGSDKQRDKIRDLGERKVWTPSEAVAYLKQANGNLDVFIKLLETKVKLPGKSPIEQGADWLKKNWKALLGMKPTEVPAQTQPAGAAAQPPAPTGDAATEVDAVRQAVNGFSRNIRRDATRRTRRADRLEAEFHRK